MTYYKFVLFTYISISFYGFHTTETSSLLATPKNKTITKTTAATKKTLDTVVNAKTDKTVSYKELTVNNEIKDNIQTAYLTINTTIDHSLWDSLLQKHVSNEGQVNYKGFQGDQTKFDTYLNLLSNTPPKEFWSRNETLAFWINVYNAYTVKLILNNYPIQSIKDISKPWNERFIKIGEKWYTLNDVEHRIIRKMDEPRIHFALVCAAVSCPKLYNRAFTAKNLDSNLTQLTQEFLNDGSKNRLRENTIEISKLFKWYGGDFKTNNKRLIDFINQYSDVQISSKAKRTYMDYDWRLNE